MSRLCNNSHQISDAALLERWGSIRNESGADDESVIHLGELSHPFSDEGIASGVADLDEQDLDGEEAALAEDLERDEADDEFADAFLED